MENINELSAKTIQSYLNKLKAKKRAETEKKEVSEAKIGDKVTVTHGSQKGLVGHVGEIRKGFGGKDHTYTVDYDDNGKRSSVQVKKAHTKLVKEGADELNRKTPTEDEIMKKHGINKTELDHHLAIGIKTEMEHTKNAMVAREIALDHISEKPDYYAKLKKVVEDVSEASIHSSYMAGRGKSGMRAKAPNASDKPDFGTYHVTVKHEGGEKTYKLKNMKEPKHAMNTAQKIHRTDNPEHKIKDVTYKKLDEENIVEVSKRLLGRYIEKAATSMSSAAFGQGQSSANRQPPREQDQKTGMKRMTGIARATSKLTKEDTEQVDELNQMTLSRYAATARVKAMNKNDPKREKRAKGNATANRKLKFGDYSEEIVTELKKSTLSSYLDKTVDPVHGMPRSAEKLPQRMKGIERATKKILAKEETGKPERDGKKRSREAYINKKNREEHQTHLGIHEGKLTPHEVSLQLKHPNLEGVARKIVKVHATSPKHAEEVTSKHYANQGYKVHKVDYSKIYKQNLGPTKAEKEQEEMKKEDDKIKKIAKAVKGAMK